MKHENKCYVGQIRASIWLNPKTKVHKVSIACGCHWHQYKPGAFFSLCTHDENGKPEKRSTTLGQAPTLAHATSWVLWDDTKFCTAFRHIHSQWALCPVTLLAMARCQSRPADAQLRHLAMSGQALSNQRMSWTGAMSIYKWFNVLPLSFVSIPDSSQVTVNEHHLSAMLCSKFPQHHKASTTLWNSLHNAVVCISLSTSVLDMLTTISLGQLEAWFVGEQHTSPVSNGGANVLPHPRKMSNTVVRL